MPRDRQKAGPCPRCDADALTCTYNRFEDAAERIDAWEHRCLSCSFRETKALRGEEEGEREVCPFCGRRAAA